ncbi:hypothetical protein ACHAWU_003813 [Discostella pseudostelligera]|uniref:SCP domain-containing protein n=1 Tax=Discostella pseudostelligera TaxID=259834 RepID=A0ABD3MMG1_9STRA
MKLTFLLSSLFLVSVDAGLRSSTETNLVVADDSNEVVYDDASNHRHELDTHHHQRILHHDGLARDAPSSRSLGSDPLLPGISISTRNDCSSNQRGVRIVIKTDQEGHETSWSFRRLSDSQADYLGPDDGGNYESSTTYSGTICAPIGMYQFIIKDSFRDGLCCASGSGYYSVEVQNENGSWRDAVKGNKFLGAKQHIVDVGRTESTMTDRDKAYLVAHNKRRMEWHAYYGKQYVPLKWSRGLKESSKEYADKLLAGCKGDDPKHDPYTIYGENLARNEGSGFWGQLYEPDDIVNRFVEREVGLPWAKNGHLTNVLWRATQYVGCAESETSYSVTKPNGHVVQHTCRIQVCRYAKPGNCSMGSYRRSNGIHDWVTPMLMDDSPCGPDCPPEGCYD